MFKECAVANLVLFVVPITIGLVASFLVFGAMTNPGGYAFVALACYGIGFASFAAAKIHSIRGGHPVSFGSSSMSPVQRWAYRIGYALMVFGLFLTMALLVASKFKG